MKQVSVKAIAGFDHNGRRRFGDVFAVSEMHAKQLIGKGLVVEDEESSAPADPTAPTEPDQAAAPISSASTSRRRGSA